MPEQFPQYGVQPQPTQAQPKPWTPGIIGTPVNIISELTGASDQSAYDQEVARQQRAAQAVQFVNERAAQGVEPVKAFSEFLGSLETREPGSGRQVLQDVISMSPGLASDAGVAGDPSMRDAFIENVRAAQRPQVPAGREQFEQGLSAGATPAVATATPPPGMTPASQQSGSNPPGQARGAAAQVGQRGPADLARQAPGSGVGTGGIATAATAPVAPQGFQPPTPPPAFQQLQQGMRTETAKGRTEQGVAENQQAIIDIVRQAQSAGLPVPPEWRAIAEGRPVEQEATSGKLAESQRERGFRRELAEFQEPVEPVLGPGGSTYQRRSQAVGQQVGSAPEVGASERVQLRNEAEEKEMLRRGKGLIGMIREQVSKPGSVAGVSGAAKSFGQRLAGTAQEALGLAEEVGVNADPSVQKYLAEAKAGTGDRDADTVRQLSTALATIFARLQEPGGRLTDQDVKRAEAALGLDRFIQDEKGMVQALETAERMMTFFSERDQETPEPEAQAGGQQPAETASSTGDPIVGYRKDGTPVYQGKDGKRYVEGGG